MKLIETIAAISRHNKKQRDNRSRRDSKNSASNKFSHNLPNNSSSKNRRRSNTDTTTELTPTQTHTLATAPTPPTATTATTPTMKNNAMTTTSTTKSSSSKASTTASTASTTSTASTGQTIALLDIDEIIRGKQLGLGGFSDVFEVAAIHLNQDRQKSLPLDQQQSRLEVQARAAKGKLAIKILQQRLMEHPKRFDAAVNDLNTETKILQRLDHDNIVRIWGTSASSKKSDRAHDHHFIILDRLHGTLEDTIENWTNRERKIANNPMRTKRHKRRKQQELFLERLRVAIEVAKVLEYMHGLNLVYRDLKPNNIGFDPNGNLKVFDFGLARSIPKTKDAKRSDVFKMSGKAGTVRYMAPEVFLKQPYNETADVYSFSHLLWEILTLEKPYDGFSRKMHYDQVVREGRRLHVSSSWSPNLCDAVDAGWAQNIANRPSMTILIVMLQHEMAVLSGESSPRKRVEQPDEPIKGESSKFMTPTTDNEDEREAMALAKQQSLISRAA